MRQRTLLLTTVTASLLLSAPISRADDRSAARPLFEEGRKLMKAGKTAEACSKFEAAARLTQTSGVRLNLAVCWEKLGRIASAWEMYEEARAIAERAGDKAQLELSEKGKMALEPKLPHVLVSVPAAVGAVQGLHVMRDGEPVLSGAWGVAVPVDPGTHEISASAPEHRPWSTKVDIQAGAATVTVTIPQLDAESMPVVVAPPAPEHVAPSLTAPSRGSSGSTFGAPSDATPAQPSAPGSTQRWLGIAAAGLGVVGLGIGSYFGLHASSLKNDYLSHESGGHCSDAECQADSQSAASAGNASTAFFVAGAVLAGGGVALWLTAPKGSESGVSAKVVSLVDPRTAGVAVQGAW